MIARALCIWLGISILAIANGAVRETVLRKIFSELIAHVISTLVLSGVIFVTALMSIRWIGVESLGEAWLIGAIWLTATMAFEFLIGHFVFKNTWERIRADYNLAKGRVWILVPLSTLFAPAFAQKGFDSKWALAYSISNLAAVALLFLAMKKPNLFRYLIVLLFLYAGIYNSFIAAQNPTEYLNFGKYCLVPPLTEFIYGAFAMNLGPMIQVIAVGQLLCAALLLIPNRQTILFGTVGVVTFLVAIAPLGLGSALPFGFIVAMAAIIAASRIAATPRATLEN